MCGAVGTWYMQVFEKDLNPALQNKCEPTALHPIDYDKL